MVARYSILTRNMLKALRWEFEHSEIPKRFPGIVERENILRFVLRFDCNCMYTIPNNASRSRI